jgi:hypothetical protein
MRTSRRGLSVSRRRRITILAGALCASLIALAFVGSASAKVVNLRVYDGPYPNGTFFGEGSVGPGPVPLSEVHELDINRSNGDFIVGNSEYLYRFSSAGVAKAFPALGTTTMVGPVGINVYGDVAFDNSGGSGGVGEGEQGRVYGMSEYEGKVVGWKANGEPVSGGFAPPAGVSYGGACGFDVDPEGDVWIVAYNTGIITEFNPDGTPTGTSFNTGLSPCGVEIDDAGNFFIGDYGGTGVWKFSPAGTKLSLIDPDPSEARDIAVDNSDGHIYTLHYNHVNEFSESGALVTEFGFPEGTYEGFFDSGEGIGVDETTHVVYVGHYPGRVDAFIRTGNITVPDVTTEGAEVTATTATIHGTVDRDVPNGGAPINACSFKYGTESANLTSEVPCEGSAPFSGAVQANIGGLTTGTTYYYKIVASNESNNVPSTGGLKELQPAGPPEISEEAVPIVNTDGATITGKIAPGGKPAEWWLEYGTTLAYGQKLPVPPAKLKDNLAPEKVTLALSGLAAGTEYHYRFVAENATAKTEGDDHTFTTFPSPVTEPDSCSNAQVRQQTGAAQLFDCRAYELASSGNTNGYDVSSTLVPGQKTLLQQPGAGDHVLYSMQFGTVPGAGDPTNFELDPYVATRNEAAKRWETKYVGIPASGTPSTAPFGSPMLGSSAGLGSFAFGNGTLCDPCFSDGSIGIPVHRPNGSLVQGLKGSIPNAGAEPAGYIGQSLSDDGDHLVFGSNSKLESAATEGNLTIYERDLGAGTTQVVSTQPNGTPMTGTVAGLDVSTNGSRVLVGKAVSTDAKGNTYYDLFMHVGNSPNSVQIADTANGVLFNGMTADGSKVFFTTVDQFTGDTDTSADLYRADVTSSTATVSRVSTGTGSGNTDGCDPVPGKEGPNWNVIPGGPQNCGIVALAGGAGVSSGDGTVFFLSPEKLDGGGVLNEPNLFVARPGAEPEYVTTIEPAGEIVLHGVNESKTHRYEDFQVSADGDFAVLASTLSLTGPDTFNRSQVFRYDTDAGDLVCASCATTGATPTGNATLSKGLNLTDDGRVFFTSVEPLVLRDTNNRLDVYEWKEGELQLVSTGISNFDAGLLGVSSDGVNAFFYTRETLAPQDKNGETMKIYDAREGGGFLQIPPLPLCAAKDECHGPGTVAAPPPQIGTFKGNGGNVKRLKCKKPKVKRNGKCVKKPKKKQKKGKRSNG